MKKKQAVVFRNHTEISFVYQLVLFAGLGDGIKCTPHDTTRQSQDKSCLLHELTYS